jgi:hypothetical protein
MYPPFISFLDCAECNVGKQRRYNPALWSTGFRAEELIFRQDTGFQELPDQPYYSLIGDAFA